MSEFETDEGQVQTMARDNTPPWWVRADWVTVVGFGLLVVTCVVRVMIAEGIATGLIPAIIAAVFLAGSLYFWARRKQYLTERLVVAMLIGLLVWDTMGNTYRP